MPTYSPADDVCTPNPQPVVVSLEDALRAVDTLAERVIYVDATIANDARTPAQLRADFKTWVAEYKQFDKRVRDSMKETWAAVPFGWGSEVAQADVMRCRADKWIERYNAATASAVATSIAPTVDDKNVKPPDIGAGASQLVKALPWIALAVAAVMVGPAIVPLVRATVGRGA